MADPLLINQSQAPLGQAPYGPIQGPGVGATLPQALDSSNLYNTLGALNNSMAAALALRKQKFEEAKDEAEKLKEAKKAVDDLFKNLMPKSGETVAGLPALDGRYKLPRQVNARIGSRMNQLQDDILTLGQTLVDPNQQTTSKDIAGFQLELSGLVNKAKVELAMDEEYIRLSKVQAAYKNTMDEINKATQSPSAKYAIIPGAFEQFTKNYEAYMNGEEGVVLTDSMFNPSQYIYDSSAAEDRLSNALTKALEPLEQDVQENINGTVVARRRTYTPTVAEVLPDLVTAFRGDKDIMGFYEYNRLTHKSSTGEDLSFDQFVEKWANMYAKPDQTTYQNRLHTPFNTGFPSNPSRRPGGDGSAPLVPGEQRKPRSYAQWTEDVRNSVDLTEYMFSNNIKAGTSPNLPQHYGAINQAIANFGYDPLTTMGSLAPAVDVIATGVGEDKPNVKYLYNKFTDSLDIFIPRDGEKGEPATVYEFMAFVPSRFTDYNENKKGIKKIEESGSYKNIYIPPEIDILNDEEFKIKVYEGVSTMEEVKEIAPLTDLYNELDRDKVDISKEKYEEVMGEGSFKASMLGNPKWKEMLADVKQKIEMSLVGFSTQKKYGF